MSDASRSYLYGAGVFTTIRMIKGEPWLWDSHWRRLMHDCERIGIDASPYSEYMVRRGLDESIPDGEKSKPLRARITITDETPSPLWSDAKGQAPSNVTFLVSTLRIPPRPFRLGLSPLKINSISPIAGLKTCNYLEQMMSLNEATGRGFQEAVRVNEHGYVTSACMANIFWLKGGQLFTPAFSTGCLPGTTREFVCENLDVTEVETDVDDVRRAAAIFLTSAGLGVVQVDEFDGQAIETVDHAILSLIPR